MVKELLFLKNPQLTDFNVHFGKRNCRTGVHSRKGFWMHIFTSFPTPFTTTATEPPLALGMDLLLSHLGAHMAAFTDFFNGLGPLLELLN